MKSFHLLIYLTCLSSFAIAQPVYTLQQCIEAAIANNINVQQSAFQLQRDEATLQQSKANRLPDVNAAFNFGGNRGRSIDPFTNGFVNQAFTNSNANLFASLPLYNGGQISNLIHQNQETLLASEMDLQQNKDNITIQVIAAYLMVLSNEDLLVITRSQEAVSAKLVERLQIVAAEGATAPYNLSDLKGELASNKVNVLNGATSVAQAKITLTRLMNVPYDPALTLSREGISILSEPYGLSAEQVYQEALQQMSMVKANDHRIAAADRAVRVAKGGYYPSLFLNGGLGTNYSSAAEKFSVLNEFFGPTEAYVLNNGVQNPVYTKQQNLRKDAFGFTTQYSNNINAQYGISLQIPIVSRFTVRNRVTQARIDLRQADAVSSNVKNQLQQDVSQAHTNMLNAYDRFGVLQDQVNALKESFEAAEARFDNGVINAAEFLLIKNNYDRSQVNRTQAGYEYVLRTRILDYYRGQLP